MSNTVTFDRLAKLKQMALAFVPASLTLKNYFSFYVLKNIKGKIGSPQGKRAAPL